MRPPFKTALDEHNEAIRASKIDAWNQRLDVSNRVITRASSIPCQGFRQSEMGGTYNMSRDRAVQIARVAIDKAIARGSDRVALEDVLSSWDFGRHIQLLLSLDPLIP